MTTQILKGLPTMTTPIDREALYLELAKKHFFIETLETRERDSLDFHDVAVWSIRAALEEAYEAGRASAAKR
jgi:hypothetical protein